MKHYYNAVFSPSGTQRFISRFLVNAWMSGPEKINPGKALLCRMIPSGLVEYLKHAPITDEHRRALDEIEDDFYSKFAGGGHQGFDGSQPRSLAAAAAVTAARATDSQARMRKRISAVLKERTLGAREGATDVSSEDLSGNAAAPVPAHGHGASSGGPGGGGPSGGPSLAVVAASAKSPTSATGIQFTENYRIMFHMMTRDHQLPDLIWNEQTRLELRSALETEIRNFDREQTLRGTKKVAWNYQQFHVRYESLRNEMQVGPIYIRYFLDAGESFLRSLENPSHVILFEKLLRRVLVNVTRNPPLSILCTRSLIRLYAVCQDVIGGFDDMLLIVKVNALPTRIYTVARAFHLYAPHHRSSWTRPQTWSCSTASSTSSSSCPPKTPTCSSCWTARSSTPSSSTRRSRISTRTRLATSWRGRQTTC